MTGPVIEIVIVGNEILADPAHERNAAHMAGVLGRAGYGVSVITVVGDAMEAIGGALETAAGRADAVLVTGGLGPTSDDITIAAAAVAFGLDLELNEHVLADIEDRFRRFGRPMTDSNRRQAYIPAGAEVLPNPAGTAPGVALDHGGTLYCFMPGVPREMAAILEDSVMPMLAGRFVAARVTTAELQVTGISESGLFDRIRDISGVIETARFYPRPTGITLRFVAPETSGFDARAVAGAVSERLGSLVFAAGDATLEAAVGALFAERGLTIAVAESCTGGLVADRLTDVPGSSRYFLMGAVTYANEAKIRVLGVPSALIATHGAVSEPVAAAMAEGVRALAGADIGVSTTGIAGPGGATETKPAGLMYAGLAHGGGTITKRLQFAEDRRINKERMSQAVLDMVRLFITESEALS